MAPRHIGRGSQVAYISQPVSWKAPSCLQASRMATISACAVGSFVEVTWLVPSAMIFPPFAMTAAKGPPFPDRTFSSESSMALAMKRFDMMVKRLTVRAARFARHQILAGRSARPALKDTQILYGCSETSFYLLYCELPLSAIEFWISLRISATAFLTFHSMK